MKVTFKAPQVLGNKPYPAGTQEIPDHLMLNAAFKKLAQAGHAIVHPRDEASQAMQAQKDAAAARKASEKAPAAEVAAPAAETSTPKAPEEKASKKASTKSEA